MSIQTINNQVLMYNSQALESSATAVNAKIFNLTLASAITNSGTLVSGDSDVASHYTDTLATITIHKVDGIEVDGNGFISSGNAAFGTAYGTRINSNSGTAGAGAILYPINTEPTTAVSVGCNSSGDIKIRVSTGRNCLPTGTYKIIFTW